MLITSIVIRDCKQSVPGRSATPASENHPKCWLSRDDTTDVIKSVIQAGCADGDVNVMPAC